MPVYEIDVHYDDATDERAVNDYIKVADFDSTDAMNRAIAELNGDIHYVWVLSIARIYDQQAASCRRKKMGSPQQLLKEFGPELVRFDPDTAADEDWQGTRWEWSGYDLFRWSNSGFIVLYRQVDKFRSQYDDPPSYLDVSSSQTPVTGHSLQLMSWPQLAKEVGQELKRKEDKWLLQVYQWLTAEANIQRQMQYLQKLKEDHKVTNQLIEMDEFLELVVAGKMRQQLFGRR